jgi:predicted acyltransferase
MRLATWRIPGVLQRTGICYFAAALIYLHFPLRRQWIIGAAALIGYAALLFFVGAPGVAPGQMDPTANLPRWVDLAVFSRAHLLRMWPTDPEGLLSTPAAVVTVLLGCWVGRCLVNRPLSYRSGALIIASGFICSMLGWAMSPVLPIIKMIWTPTYVMFTGGWAMMCYGLCYLYSDMRPAERWIWGLQIFGRNAIFSYVLSELAHRAFSAFEVHGTPFSMFMTDCMVNLSRGFISEKLGSLLYACMSTFVIWYFSYMLYQRRWFIRV